MTTLWSRLNRKGLGTMAGSKFHEENGMKQISEGVFFIPGQDEMIPDSHVYLLGIPDSDDLSLVDAGLMGKGRYKIDSIQ